MNIFAQIPYEIRNPIGDWSPYFGTYESQKFGHYDTNCCWDFAGAETAEDQLEFLWKSGLFSSDTMRWFKEHKYIDDDGDFHLSRRWIAILAGTKEQGNDQMNFWDLASKTGLIPDAMLPYSITEAQKYITAGAFYNDYFNPRIITREMEDMGLEFLRRVKIQYKEVGRRWSRRDPTEIMAELKQSPLQIGVPVPQDGSWNVNKVTCLNRELADHSVELYKYDIQADPDFPYFIYDQYEPHLKQLRKDYYIPIITKVVLTAIPVWISTPKEKTVWGKIWEAVDAWFESSYATA